MNKGKRQTPSDQDPRTLYEDIELGVYQSTNVNELDAAYRSFLDLSTNLQQQVADEAGPARVVSLALRGYELPDAQTRYRSSEFIIQLSRMFDVASDPLKSEQFWLMLAAQQGILLERIEADLDALQRSSLDQAETKRRRTTLGKVHKLLRRKADEVVRSLFATPLETAHVTH